MIFLFEPKNINDFKRKKKGTVHPSLLYKLFIMCYDIDLNHSQGCLCAFQSATYCTTIINMSRLLPYDIILSIPRGPSISKKYDEATIRCLRAKESG